MSQRQTNARTRWQRTRSAAPVIVGASRELAPVDGRRATLLSGTALAALVSYGLFAFTQPAGAQLPTGGVVTGGSATITQTGTSQLTVNQATDRGVIDWRSFSIGQGNRVDFNQPGRTSVTLNRVTGPDPSVIAGSLNANGQIILVNQAGVMFAGGAQVNVESLIASTANVANPKAFMAGGKVAFDQASANPNARVVNDGSITVRDGGLVALLGPSVANNGVINAKLGRVNIGGAETFTVDLNGDGLVNFAIGNPVSQTPRDKDGKALPLASNTGTINADGGQVAITAAAAREVVNGVVNVEGRINARSVKNEGGVIVFGGGDTTQVNVGGTIDVSGAGAAQKGGTAQVTAAKVHVQSTARINANGGAGGGTVLIGGGKQGQGPIANARNVTVDKGAAITADATHKGNGGTAIIWADHATVFGGSISAKGGPDGGNGGFAEVSGKVYLSFDGAVDLRAAAGGITGTLLLDPSDITISNSNNNNIAQAGTNPTTITGTANSSNIKASTIETLLLTTSVVVDAAGGGGAGTGSITISDGITSVTGNSLTFNALTDITVGASISLTNATVSFVSTTGALNASTNSVNANTVTFNMGGAVTLNNANNSIANVSGTAGGAINFRTDQTLTIAAGGLTSGAATSVTVLTTANKSITVTGNVSGTGVSITADGNLTGNGAISGGTGAVSLKADGSSGINLGGAITGTGLTVQSDNGGVTLSSVDNVFNSFTATGGAIGGNVSVVHKGGLSIAALDVGTKTVSFTTNNAGDITLSGVLDSVGGVTLNSAGTLAINAKINSTGANVELTGTTAITQAAGAIITANGLGVSSSGTADLSQATNVAATLAANVGSIAFLESNGFSISQVGATVGLTATGTAQLKAGGAITQDQAVSAGTLGITTTAGSVNLTTKSNSVGTLAVSSASSVGLLETNALVIGQAGAVGTLAALDGISANGVSIKAGGTVSQTKSITGGAGGLAVVTTSGNIDLGSVENSTSAVAFDSAGSAAYKTSGDLNVTQVAAVGSLAAVNGATITTNLTLETTGANTVIAQTKSISASTVDVTTGGGGTVTLTNPSNQIATVQSTGGIGTGTHQIVDSAGGLGVGALTSGGNLSITTTGDLTITGDLNVGTKALNLTAKSGGAITATASVVTAGTLTLEGGAVNFDSPTTHNVATVQTTATGVAGIIYKQKQSGLAIGLVNSTDNVSISESGNNANVTVGGAITATGKLVTVSANAGTGQVIVNAAISAQDVALIGRGGVSQADAGAAITSSTLRGESSNGNVSLAPNTDANNVTTFAGFSTTGSLSYRSVGTFTVGKVNNTSGINAATTVSLQVNNAGGTISQSAGADGAIVTPTLNVTTNNGSVTIDSANNDIAALGTVSLGTGSFTLATARAGGFDVGAVTANGGIDITNTGKLTTSAAIASNGDISLRSINDALILGGTVTSNNKGITLRSKNALDTGAFAVSAPTAVTGDVTLISDTGTVTIGAGGITVGDTLTIQIGAGLTLTVAGAINATSVALHADIIEISAAINATGTITLAPVTAGTASTIGGAAAAGFVIDSTELTFLNSAATLTIGKQSTGTTTAGAIAVDTGTVGNATLNLFASAGVTQSGGLIVGGGSGAVNVTAGGAVALTGANQVGSIGGSTTSGSFAFLRSGGAAQTLTVNAITTTNGDISIRNFDGNVTASGAVASGGGNILLGANANTGEILTLNAAVNAGTGSVFLFSNGGIVQNAGGIVTAANLLANTTPGGTGSISLTANNVVSGNVGFSTPDGSSISFTNTKAFVVGGVSSLTVAGLNFSLQDGPGIRTAAGGTVTLTVADTVTQAAGATDIISTGTLVINRIGAANPAVTLDNANNVVTNLGAMTIGTGAFTLVDKGGLVLTGAVTAGSFSVKTDNGSLTQNAGSTINTSASNGTVTLTTTTAGSVNLNDAVNAGTGLVSLNAAGAVNQAAGAITASAVSAVGTASFVSLTSATNAFGAISGSAGGGAGFSATTTTSLTSGAITTVNGIVTLTTTGGTSDLSVNGLISGASTVTLTAGKNLSQTATGGVSASALQANATNGTVDLTAGAANNKVSTLAGQSNGSFAYTDAGTAALTIGTVSTAGITSATDSIAVKVTNAGATLTTTSQLTVSAANKAITLESKGDLTVNSTLTANAASGLVSLASSAGSVIEQTSGKISAAQLLAVAATNVDVAQSSNAVGATGFAAKATTGFVVFINTGAITLDTVSGVNGVSAGGAVVLATTSGDISQTANGIITAGAGLGLAANNGSITLDKANLITGNVAVVNTPNGDVTIRNTGDFNVGTVGPITTAGVAVPALNGIAASTAAGKFIALISDTGTITQSAGAANAIVGNELRITTSGKDATLTNAANQITAVGNSNLGDGRLTVFDSAADLSVSNPVVANGGVILTTQTAFNLPGSITVLNGDISLTSLTGSIALGSTLSAVNGQIQLDAGGAGTITQTGGTITSKTLIVRAPGSVTLVEAANDVGAVAGSSGSGTFTYVNKTALTIGSLVDSTAVTVNGITTANQDIIVVAGKGGTVGGISVDKVVNAGTAIVRMETSKGDITQKADGLITANSLMTNAFAGSVNLAAVANPVSFVAGKVAGSFRLQTSGVLGVSSVAADGGALTTAPAGITASGDVALQTVGTLSLLNGINAGAGTVRLRTTGGGNISQLAGAPIVAGALLVDATGTVTLTAAAANDVGTLAGRTTSGAFSYQDANDVTVGSILADGGGLGPVLPIGPLAGVLADGDVSLTSAGLMTLGASVKSTSGSVTANSTAGGLTVSSTVDAVNAVSLTASGAVAIDGAVTSSASTVTIQSTTDKLTTTKAIQGSGNVSLTSVGLMTLGASVKSTSGGVTAKSTAGDLTVGSTVDASGAISLTAKGAAAINGAVTTSGSNITVAAEGSLAINAAINAGFGLGTIRIFAGSGDLTQGAGGTITGGSLLAVSSGGMVNLTGATNTVSGIAGSAFTSFLFQNSVGITVSNVAFAGDGIVPGATGITANSGGGATARVVDLAVASGTLAINGPVSSANGMIVYRRTPTGSAGAINVGGGGANPGNDVSTAKLVVIDHTGATPGDLYGTTPGVALGGLFTSQTPPTGTSPLTNPGVLAGGSSNFGDLSALNSTVYLFGSGATYQSVSANAVFGLLGVYGSGNTVQMTTTVRAVNPNAARFVTDPFTESTVVGSVAAFHVRHDGLPVGTEQFNACPIGTINCTIFTTPIAAPAVSTEDVVIGVAGAPLDDSGIVLVNQGNEELIIDVSEEERRKREEEEKRRKQAGGTGQ